MVQVVSRTLRASGCTNCRVSVLRTLAAISGLPSYTLQHATNAERSKAFPHRRFSSNTPSARRFEEDVNTSTRVIEALEDTQLVGGQEKVVNNIPATADDLNSVPWYLQVNSPARIGKPLSERQKIPDLPESPPDILQPLLSQISVDLGLDDLTILDLRKLDPPPALGANLLMILGTARSEKHLHVSADRLCRWLRSNYKLRPDADGLLGRNELKLKLKRKARRAKLVGNSTEEDDADDGVRTGWVCVNVGTVEAPATTSASEGEIRNFVGFGRQTEGVKIVVQMLVEEKRQEINLESLWTGISNRQSLPETLEADIDDLSPTPAVSSRGSDAVSSVIGPKPAAIQSRRYHTSARQFNATLPDVTSTSALMPMPSPDSYSALFQSVQNKVLSAVEAGDYSAARRLVIDNNRIFPELKGDQWRPYLLHQLISRLEKLPPELALKELGLGHEDRISTAFLSCFYQTLSRFPSSAEWESHISLFCLANDLGHTGYGSALLHSLFTQMQISGCQIPVRTWLAVLRSMLRGVDITTAPNPDALHNVFVLLQKMQSHGNDLMDEELWVSLHEAIAASQKNDHKTQNLTMIYNSSADTFGLPVRSLPPLYQQLNTVMLGLNVPITSTELQIRLLSVLARQDDWVSFWLFWRSIARHGQPRSFLLYACMFNLVAEVGDQRACMTVLRAWIPDMDVEEPSVQLAGVVREAVEACLMVVDPYMSGDDAKLPGAKGEWVGLWRRCNAATF
jgi:hypothetical protein